MSGIGEPSGSRKPLPEPLAPFDEAVDHLGARRWPIIEDSLLVKEIQFSSGEGLRVTVQHTADQGTAGAPGSAHQHGFGHS